MPSRIFAVALLFASMSLAQNIDLRKVATVHVYREGRLLMGVSLSADGKNVAFLSPNHMATFYMAPGYHELTLESGEICPKASFKALAGGEYFFRANYEHVVSDISLRSLKISLTAEPNIGDAENLKEVVIDQDKLAEILKLGNPSGLEPVTVPESKPEPNEETVKVSSATASATAGGR
jgi:hypothetical protein